jgi:hypothetical protein
MATMIVKHRVANFDSWKQIFDEMDASRRAYGWTGLEVYRDASDPNVVTIVNHVKDLARAKEYGGSPDLRAAMQKGGVQGVPEISFLDDAEAKKY